MFGPVYRHRNSIIDHSQKLNFLAPHPYRNRYAALDISTTQLTYLLLSNAEHLAFTSLAPLQYSRQSSHSVCTAGNTTYLEQVTQMNFLLTHGRRRNYIHGDGRTWTTFLFYTYNWLTECITSYRVSATKDQDFNSLSCRKLRMHSGCFYNWHVWNGTKSFIQLLPRLMFAVVLIKVWLS